MCNTPVALLRGALRLHDTGNLKIRCLKSLWPPDFSMGAAYMAAGLSLVLHQPIDPPMTKTFNRLGLIKYGTASLLALLFIVLGIIFQGFVWIFLSPVVFYLAEVTMAFVFPLALEKSQHPFRESWTLIRRKGGPLKNLFVIVPIAGFMVGGGFFGQGFVRSWCVGCLAVVLWYVDVRDGQKEKSHGSHIGNWVTSAPHHPA